MQRTARGCMARTQPRLSVEKRPELTFRKLEKTAEQAEQPPALVRNRRRASLHEQTIVACMAAHCLL